MAVPNDLGPFLSAWVATQSDLVLLVGTRVVPWKRLQGTELPAIVYQEISGTGIGHLVGLSGLDWAVYQIDCYAATYKQARAIAALVRGRKGDPRLDRYVGTLANTTVRAIFCQDQRDGPENPQHGDDAGTCCVQLDMKCWFDFVT